MILPRVLFPVFSVLLLTPISAQALEPLGDDSLSDVIGQDGMTLGVKLPNAALKFSQLSLIDTNGIAGGDHLAMDYSSPGAWVYAPQNYDTNGVAQLFSDGAFSVASSQPLTVKVDAGSGAAGASVNVELSMPSDMVGLRVNPFSLYLWDGVGSIYDTVRPTLQNGVTEVIRSGAINALFGVAPTMTLQLATEGPQGQGHMLSFSAGTLSCASNIADACGPIPAASTDKLRVFSSGSGDSQISLDFLFDARDYGGLSLAGLYADVDADGLLIGYTGPTSKFDAHLRNVEFGTIGVASPDGLVNGQAISSMGLEGMTITGLQTRIQAF